MAGAWYLLGALWCCLPRVLPLPQCPAHHTFQAPGAGTHQVFPLNPPAGHWPQSQMPLHWNSITYQLYHWVSDLTLVFCSLSCCLSAPNRLSCTVLWCSETLPIRCMPCHGFRGRLAKRGLQREPAWQEGEGTHFFAAPRALSPPVMLQCWPCAWAGSSCLCPLRDAPLEVWVPALQAASQCLGFVL